MSSITPWLWFDTEAEEAATFWTELFPNSRIVEVTRYGPGGPREEGSVMTVAFELDGRRYVGLNGGPEYRFSEASSLQVLCEAQGEVDRYWNALTADGEEGPCGWCKDRFGFSWQIVPKALPELLGDPDRGRAQRAMQAMLGMKRLDVAALCAAADSS
jgi:predicted 3-demethylubiquinone-9 3-methyltransferase (glyoxalase superfamily)